MWKKYFVWKDKELLNGYSENEFSETRKNYYRLFFCFTKEKRLK